MPTFGGDGGSGSGEVPRKSATLVARIATTISITKGIAARRVSNPAMSRQPPTISSPPMNEAVSAGIGKPSLVKRPTP
jgi:hypothetical protein